MYHGHLAHLHPVHHGHVHHPVSGLESRTASKDAFPLYQFWVWATSCPHDTLYDDAGFPREARAQCDGGQKNKAMDCKVNSYKLGLFDIHCVTIVLFSLLFYSFKYVLCFHKGADFSSICYIKCS